MKTSEFMRKYLGNRDYLYDETGRNEMIDDLYKVIESASQLKPEMPTDEDIEKESKGYDNSMASMDESIWVPTGFCIGAIWMRDLIAKQLNNEK